MSDSDSVTPRRRRRAAGDDEDDQLYTTGGAKRMRTSDVDDEDEDDERSLSEDGPLLPDNFRRSPRNQQRQQQPRGHQPGSLVRIEMTNFVTYSKAQFSPGPNLNMIIGPNGTGKSTLVCAICLGLGWKPHHLGRAKDFGEFVKHGEEVAIIEIELAADPESHAENPVITTKITREGNKVEFAIAGKKVTNKDVKALMNSFSIQVDNLCQFLPQDRVVEFAALSPVDLLTHTQRAAAPPQMTEWHEQLKVMRKEQKTRSITQQALVDELKSKKHRQAEQQEIVDRLRERSKLQQRQGVLEQLRPFPLYSSAKKSWAEAKERAKAGEKQLAQLQRQVEPNLQAERDKATYTTKIEAIVSRRGKMVERLDKVAVEKKAEFIAKGERLVEVEARIKKARETAAKSKTSMPKLLQDKGVIERAMQNPPAEVDFASINIKRQDVARELRAAQDRRDEVREHIGSIGQHITQRQNIITQAEAEQQSLQTQAGQQVSKLRNASKDANTAWDWVQRHADHFHDRVYGPPIVEIAVKDPAHAAAVESAVGLGEMLSFTVTSSQDFKALQRALYDELKLDSINIRQSNQPLDTFRAPCSREQLQALGLEAFVVDLIDGPEPVLAMLCDNRNIHATGFTSRELNNARLDTLKASNSPISSWITPSESYQVVRRREYGDAGTSVRANALKGARFFTDAPPSHNEDAEIEARVNQAKREVTGYENQKDGLKVEFDQLTRQQKKLDEQDDNLRKEKADKQQALAQFNALPPKLANAQRKIDEARESITSAAALCRKIALEGDDIMLEKGQLAIDYAFAVNSLRDHIVQHVDVQILAIEAKSDLEQLQLRTKHERQLLKQCEQEGQRLAAELKIFLEQGKRLQAQCQAVEMDDFTKNIYDEEVSKWAEDELEVEIQSVQAQLELNGGGHGGARVLQEFEERAQLIEQKRAELADVEAVLAELDAKLVEIKGLWEPRLDELISQISEAFGENFGKIQCAGEVGVHKDEDFENWAIQIKVKFREHESLSLLDSHRQSGGERAVSTIFYLMALQSLARAPFRVVDEINQGMDPRNERLVHSRMVDIACSEQSASQYFLITPKLLGGLKYHRDMKVHCIASGEYMPDDWRTLDFGRLARTALQIRAGA
ncbi:hypothetical protein LTR62_001806 [Meristemomyces frigidus]|uniref:Structural maintenance of chromosomes protein 5 n=1 Tax=Meristemomyces frigidus TaxID=1508187 RepID=A0AAN7TTK8_9PEZI|nr:hypothetical protein LTR62_001806 [Meristemomyces frigidus]